MKLAERLVDRMLGEAKLGSYKIKTDFKVVSDPEKIYYLGYSAEKGISVVGQWYVTFANDVADFEKDDLSFVLFNDGDLNVSCGASALNKSGVKLDKAKSLIPQIVDKVSKLEVPPSDDERFGAENFVYAAIEKMGFNGM